jgi:hypothetical protein
MTYSVSANCDWAVFATNLLPIPRQRCRPALILQEIHSKKADDLYLGCKGGHRRLPSCDAGAWLPVNRTEVRMASSEANRLDLRQDPLRNHGTEYAAGGCRKAVTSTTGC